MSDYPRLLMSYVFVVVCRRWGSVTLVCIGQVRALIFPLILPSFLSFLAYDEAGRQSYQRHTTVAEYDNDGHCSWFTTCAWANSGQVLFASGRLADRQRRRSWGFLFTGRWPLPVNMVSQITIFLWFRLATELLWPLTHLLTDSRLKKMKTG